MYNFDDTIAAISTPIGEGGIGIVRLSGKDAISIADRIYFSPKGKKLKDIKSHSIVYGFVIDNVRGYKIDEALFSIMKAPKTYTKEDVVEINCHGGIVILETILQLLLREGARLAYPGEFTKRAFLNGRIDLSQAEAVIDIIRAKTKEAGRIALQQLEGRLSLKITEIRDKIAGLCANIEAYIDFPEEDIEPVTIESIFKSIENIKKELQELSDGYYEGKLFKYGVSAAIVGKPNVGKSSLLNALLQRDRAIVTEIPGTTRDIIEDYININGLPLKIIDTAGIRECHDLVEIEGIKRSFKAIEEADIVLAVLDSSLPIDDKDLVLIEKTLDKRTIFVLNKSDIESPRFEIDKLRSFINSRGHNMTNIVKVSALTGDGMNCLKDEIYSICVSKQYIDKGDIILTNVRHKDLIDKSLNSLKEAEEILRKNDPIEVSAMFIRESLDYLGEIVGIVTTEDILNRIFNEFCIGK